MPKLDVELDVDEVIEAFRRAEQRLAVNVPAALATAAQNVAREAKLNHDYEDQEGTLTNSIEAGEVSGSFAEGSLTVDVSAGAAHSLFVEEGTKPHFIDPLHRQALAWPVEGGTMFAGEVHHPGTPPSHYLKNAGDAMEPQSIELMEDAAALSFAEAGFEVD